MNLKERVIHQLEQLTAKGTEHIEAVVQKAPEQGYIVGISAEDDGAGVSVSLTDFDRYSVTLRHLEVFHNSLIVENGETEHYLHHCAAQIAHRLIYLEEPLALVELNTVDGAAQLRSRPPTNGPQDSTYWEVMVRVKPQPRARLTRYHWQAGTAQRTATTYPVTFATLGRLSEDLAKSLEEGK